MAEKPELAVGAKILNLDNKIMKTAAEILEKYIELEYDDVILAMKEYAKEAIEAQLAVAAKNVEESLGYDDRNYMAASMAGRIVSGTYRIELK